SCGMRYRQLNPIRARKISIDRTLFLSVSTVVLMAFTLAGCAPSSGNLAASSTGLSFGSVAIGSMSHQSLTLTYSTSEPSTVTQATASGEGFNFKGPPLPSTLSAGQSMTFTLSFAPTAMGTASGSLSITSSQTSSSQITGG